MNQKLRSFLSHLAERWKRFGRKVGDFQARLILTLFYFLIFGPFALLIRLAGDPLGIKPNSRHGWLSRGERQASSLEHASKQF
jgi:hypothetical protein